MTVESVNYVQISMRYSVELLREVRQNGTGCIGNDNFIIIDSDVKVQILSEEFTYIDKGLSWQNVRDGVR